MKKSINLTIRFNVAAILGVFLLFAASSVSAQVCEKLVFFTKYMPLFMDFEDKTPQCKAAKEAFDAAIVIVTGSSNYTSNKDKNIYGSSPYIWVNDLAKNPKYSAKFNEGLKFSDAVSFLKERIATNAADRQFVIDNAFREVYGRESRAEEQAQWDSQVKAQKAWYTVIVISEIDKLNSDPLKRTVVIDDVYIQTMGRTATSVEVKYWKPRTEHFRLMVTANRAFLYSGSKKANEDLLYAIRVAYLAKYAKDPSDQEKKVALTKVTDQKLVFQEMMRPNVSLK